MLLLPRFLKKHNTNKYFKRLKHKTTNWSSMGKNKTACHKALEHFDEFYNDVFNSHWPSIRQGLLGKQKYIAVINNYSDADKIKTKLENIGALNVRTLFNLEKQYINENLNTIKRRKYLQTVWKAEKQIDEKLNSEKETTTENESSRNIYELQSLEKNLQYAKIDFNRVISKENISSFNLYEFMPTTKLKGMEDWIPEATQHSNLHSNLPFTDITVKEYDIHFPEYLNVYCFENGNRNDFSAPRNGSTGVLDYYLMDGGSLLPILALDIKPGDKVLDMCASPGGKTFLALQTLYTSQIFCNDVTKGRTNRIYNVMQQYLYDFDEKWLTDKKIQILLSDARCITEEDFDKIIVDVPCTTDRHSLKEPENNIFKSGRIKERLQLPELQCELLLQALKLVKVGGNVVYSTCTLSPIQNDGVVHMVLKRIWEETNIEVSVRNLSLALLQTTSIYKLASQQFMKYGQLVIPDVQANFGPTYFCKFQRTK